MPFHPDEPPVDPLDDTNPSRAMRPVDPNDEPPISDEDTNPSRTMQTVQLDEPPIAMDDTNPSLAVREGRLIDPNAKPPLPAWRRVVGVVSLLLALALTAVTALVVLMPPAAPEVVAPPPTDAEAIAQQPTDTDTPPTDVIPTSEAVVETAQQADSVAALPTVSVEQAARILQQPVSAPQEAGVSVVRNPYEPFTLIPDRPRGEVIQYVIEDGDTISSISEKFGITPESVVWANSRDIVNVIRPGQVINIVPEDGVYIAQHVGNSTIADYAARYGIADPYEIINSEYNPALRGLTPSSIPESGTPIMIAGGVAEQISWTPVVEREAGGASGSAGGGFINFAPGEPGSCGRVENPGAGGGWAQPLSNYTWIRGFTSFHTGVDLSASIGTPVKAARAGRVIFAGWNSYGYGYTVVLAHGPFTSLYGHMSSINVSCGQDVGPGTIVGAVGNTGNSSGPHLHFEIRYNDQPQDPTLSLAF